MNFDEFCTHRPPTRQRIPFEQLLANYGEVFPAVKAAGSAVQSARRKGDGSVTRAREARKRKNRGSNR